MFEISPDGKKVANLIGRDLYLVPLCGPSTASVLLNDLALAPEGLQLAPFAFTSDSRRIVYLAEQETTGTAGLYVAHDRPAASRRWGGYR